MTRSGREPELTRLNVPLPTRAEHDLGRVEGPFARTAVLQAWALATGDAGSLDAAASAWARHQMWPYAAEAAAQAATSYDEAGHYQEGKVAAARAALFKERFTGVATPALARTRLPQLTKREHEVADLAARSLTSRQIAGQLGISVRTVESHMGAIIAKLGIEDRRELRRIFGYEE